MFPRIQMEFLCSCIVRERNRCGVFSLPQAPPGHLWAWRPRPGPQLLLPVLTASVTSWVVALLATAPRSAVVRNGLTGTLRDLSGLCSGLRGLFWKRACGGPAGRTFCF